MHIVAHNNALHKFQGIFILIITVDGVQKIKAEYMTELYVWKRPVKGSRLDHTMVTDYATFSMEPIPAVNYWYCWGVAHNTGDRFNSKEADLDLAICISTPNVHPDDHAGILGPYGFHGVCHQVANRVLYATKSDTNRPITVDGAHGYIFSKYLYGEYGTGTPGWEHHLSICGGSTTMTIDDGGNGGMAIFSPIEKDLTDAQKKSLFLIHDELLSEKKILEDRVMGEEINGEEFANQVNQLMTTKMREIAKIIGDAAYEQIFKQSPDEPVAVMDPEIAMAETETYRGILGSPQ